MPTSQKTQQIVASFQRNNAEEIGSYSIEDLEAALDDLEWRNEGIQRSINRRIDKLKTDSSKSYQSIVRAIGYVVVLTVGMIVIWFGARYL